MTKVIETVDVASKVAAIVACGSRLQGWLRLLGAEQINVDFVKMEPVFQSIVKMELVVQSTMLDVHRLLETFVRQVSMPLTMKTPFELEVDKLILVLRSLENYVSILIEPAVIPASKLVAVSSLSRKTKDSIIGSFGTMEGKLGVVAKALQSLATTAGLTLSDTTVSQQNPDYGAASVPPSTGQLIEFARTLSRKQSRYFSLLKSEVGASYTLTHLMSTPAAETSNIEDAFQKHEPEAGSLNDWLSKVGTSSPPRDDAVFNLLLCGQSNAAGAITLTMERFSEMVDKMQLSREVFQVMWNGTPMLLEEPGNNVLSYVFRTPFSNTQDWTLALSWDQRKQSINGFLHGMQDEERNMFMDIVADSILEFHHPMGLPLALCEMLLDGDRAGIKTHALAVSSVEFRTKLSGAFRVPYDQEPYLASPESGLAKWAEVAKKLNKPLARSVDPESSFAEMTRKLNFAVSRLPFHEMRLRANRALTEQIKEGMTSTDEGVKDRGREDVWVASIQNASHRLRTRLRRLEIESKALLLECESEMKIAQSQLQIVHNLVAQHDSKRNEPPPRKLVSLPEPVEVRSQPSKPSTSWLSKVGEIFQSRSSNEQERKGEERQGVEGKGGKGKGVESDSDESTIQESGATKAEETGLTQTSSQSQTKETSQKRVAFVRGPRR